MRLNGIEKQRRMSGKDWILVSVFILFHLAAAIIRGIPVELVLLGALSMLVATIVFTRRHQSPTSGS